MREKIFEDTLTVFLDERLDSNNSEFIGEKLTDILKYNAHKSLILDAGDLKYISSAGIRVILMIAKNEKNFEIVNASKEAYEIFDMTGLTSMLKISKHIRNISLDGLQKIGSGFFSDVYRKNKDIIIKVYTKATGIDDVKRELDLAKKAFVFGIPTALSFDIVKADDMLGVEFELLNCDSLKDAINKSPERFNEFMEKYAKLLLLINSTDIRDTKLQSAKSIALKKLKVAKEYLTYEEYEKANNLITKLEDTNTFIHGDCQIKNIMINDDELLLIDMDTLSFGHPIFELASLHEAYVAFPEVQKGFEGEFLGIANDLPKKIFDCVIKNYFSDVEEDYLKKNIEKISLISYLDMICWFKTNEEYSKEDLEYMCSRFKTTLENIDSLEFVNKN